MPPLTKGRETARREGDFRDEALAAAQTVFTGGIIMRQADGYLVNGATAVGLIGCGVVYGDVDNATGASGDAMVSYRRGCFRFANSTGADEVLANHIGALAYVVDDQTVAATDGAATRSPAGIIEGVDALGVWVRFDEALTSAFIG